MRLTVLSVAFALIFGLVTGQEPITNKLIWASGEFSGESVSGIRSMKDGIHYTSFGKGKDGTEVVKLAYLTGDTVAILASDATVFKNIGQTKSGNADVQLTLSIENYDFSADEKKLIIETESEALYRHSSSANYYIHDLISKSTVPLTDFSKGKQRLAEFSPDGKRVAFVRDNNLFWVELSSGKETQITSDGNRNHIINGATDWVYEEEFGFDKGFQWSPGSDRIGYYRFDESGVREFQMAMYGELYPEQYSFKYPKAGEDNAQVSIHIYDIPTNKNLKVDTGSEPDMYFPRIKWSMNNGGLCVMKMNRHQNELSFLLTDMPKAVGVSVPCTVIYNEKAETYIDVNDNLIFLPDGKGYLWNSEKDEFNHIYYFDMNGKQVAQLTRGPWDVIDFYGFEPKSKTVYFSSSKESAIEQHVYSVPLTGKGMRKLSTKPGTHAAIFSETFAYYINFHSDANTPAYITLNSGKDGKELRKMKDNTNLKLRLEKYKLSKKEFFTFKNSTGEDLNCWIIKPDNFDSNKKYPVYLSIYGGPGSNTVRDAWGGRDYFWHQMLAQKGYIVVSSDPRGTQYRGRKFKHSTYLQLGKLETEDMVDFGKWLGKQTYVDSKRIGVQGWSYGGYMTLLCLTKGADVFSAGISVAPVTNWRYYDSIYTERFMRTPQENAGGYDDNSPINHTEKLTGKLLLVHGSADDNVHYQNTMEMVNSLVKANKQFDLFIYPDRNHGIFGGNTRLHLYDMMLNFVEKNL